MPWHISGKSLDIRHGGKRAVRGTWRRGFLSLLYRGVAEDVMRNARTYLVISAVSYPFLSVYYSCAALASLISRMAACFILRLRLGGILVLIHNGCAILIWPAFFCLADVLRAANDVKFPMCVSSGSMVVFRIGFSFLLAAGLGMGAVGVWWTMTADWAVRSSFFAWRSLVGSGRRFMSGVRTCLKIAFRQLTGMNFQTRSGTGSVS